jgi:solute:Na+ symporter, SSS family
MLCVLGVGFYYFHKNKNTEDYYVGGRRMSPEHVGISIVATDVGGGFTIGLGGLGFLIGISGSWLLFTGLVGAWLTAVFLLPRIKKIDKEHKLMTYPDFLRCRYNEKVAVAAAVISGIGYMGFTGAQVLAGAKLASSTIITQPVLNIDPMIFALFVIGIIIIGYTVLGGLKAVIYTDTVQWIILLLGLILVAIPLAFRQVGGLAGLKQVLPSEFFSLTNVSITQIVNWFVTIIPIWFVGMTLYQRMFALKDLKDAKKAWYIAGVFEYPVMAFMGVILGMCARVLFPAAEPETGIPLIISHVLPVGLKGIVIAAYFSAIMSTADSCLMASSGNFLNDILERHFLKESSPKAIIRLSQLITLIIGVVAILLAAHFTMVLDAILYAYSFIVSGLFVPTLGAYFWKKSSSTGALYGMLSGGILTLFLIIMKINLPMGLDATLFGILLSAVTFIILSILFPDKNKSITNNDINVEEQINVA